MLELTKVENIFCREENIYFQNGVGLKSNIDCYIYPEGRKITKELLYLQFQEGRILIFEKQSSEEFHSNPYLNVYADFALNRGLGLAKSIVNREPNDDFPMSNEYLMNLPKDIELDYGYVPNYSDVNFPTNHHFHPYGFICNIPNMFDEWESLRLLNQLIKSFPLRKYEYFTIAINWKINKQDDDYSSSDFRIYGTANGKYGYTHMIRARYGLDELESLVLINDYGFNQAYGKYESSNEEENIKRNLLLKDMYARRVDNVYNYEANNYNNDRAKKFKELMDKGVTLSEFFESEYEIYDELECLEIDKNISFYEAFFGVEDFGIHKDNINKIIHIFKKYASKEEICKIISFYLSVKQMQENPGVGCGNNIIFCINKKQKEMIAQPIYKLFYILDEVCVGEFKNKSLGNGVCSIDSSIYSNVVLDDPYIFSSKKTGYNNPFDNFIKGDIRIIVVEDKEYNEKIRDNSLENNEVAPYGYMIHDVVYIRRGVDIIIDEINSKLHILPEMADNFVERLYDFVYRDYEKSNLDMAVYSDYLLFRIMYNYYKVPRKPREKLGVDCIPYSNSIGKNRNGIPEISVDSVFEEIDKLYGLKEVKEFFRRLYKSQKYSLENNKDSFEQKNRYHMFFMGNPGTGKTHVARLTARLLYAMGI
ncbi:MAG: hypothetical protein J6A59_09565, partial [Lachnospiraceae bacterium]|nr:hypothetical protein [Lachnospiraceae bacterium]